MTPFVIGNIQFILSLIVFGLIAAFYVWPVLNRRRFRDAVLPLLFLHAFRYGPLTLLMPGQVDRNLALSVREPLPMETS